MFAGADLTAKQHLTFTRRGTALLGSASMLAHSRPGVSSPAPSHAQGRRRRHDTKRVLKSKRWSKPMKSQRITRRAVLSRLAGKPARGLRDEETLVRLGSETWSQPTRTTLQIPQAFLEGSLQHEGCS